MWAPLTISPWVQIALRPCSQLPFFFSSNLQPLRKHKILNLEKKMLSASDGQICSAYNTRYIISVVVLLASGAHWNHLPLGPTVCSFLRQRSSGDWILCVSSMSFIPCNEAVNILEPLDRQLCPLHPRITGLSLLRSLSALLDSSATNEAVNSDGDAPQWSCETVNTKMLMWSWFVSFNHFDNLECTGFTKVGAVMKADLITHYILLCCLRLHRQHQVRGGGLLPLINPPQQLGW